MGQRTYTLLLALTCVAVFIAPAQARMPRGVVLNADEQLADETTGAVVARGRAELYVTAFAIAASADAIEIAPGRNEISFTGGARVRIGSQSFAGAAVTCTLDFERCAAGAAGQSAAPPGEAAAMTPR